MIKIKSFLIEKYAESKKWSIILFLTISIAIYTILVCLFGFLYLVTNSIGNSGSPDLVINFFDSTYFSFVSFLTIGYGDLYPIKDIGKLILFMESIFALVFNGLFGGGLVYLILRRPNNILISNYLNIKFKDNSYYLSQRIGNKGEPIVNCQIEFNVFSWNNNIRNIIFSNKYQFPIMENGVTLFTLKQVNSPAFFQHISKIMLNDKSEFYASLTFVGNDSSSGQPLSIRKYYSKDDIKFVIFLSKLTTWKDGKSHTVDWKNFNSHVPMSNEEVKEFLNFFQN